MRNLILISLLAFLVAGCAGTAKRVQVPYHASLDTKLSYNIVPKIDVSEEALGILRQRLDTGLSTSGLLAVNPEDSGREVEITIINYYMRHGATRALVGIMAGADNMQSKVIVRDRSTKAILGEFVVESKNPSAWGTSKRMIQEHADKIVHYLSSGGT